MRVGLPSHRFHPEVVFSHFAECEWLHRKIGFWVGFSMSHLTVELVLGRHDLIYHYGEIVSGVVAINVQGRSGSHTGAILQVDGRVALKPSSKSQTLFSAGPRNPEPLIKISKTLDIPEKLPLGKHQFPFDFALEPADSLLETYQGVYVSVQYEITFTLNRGLLVDKIEKTLEFIVLANPKNEIETKPISFSLSPATVTRSYVRLL